MFLTKTYLLRPESRKPLANGFLSIFRRVICRVEIKLYQIFETSRKVFKDEMVGLQVIPKLTVFFSPVSQIFYYY